MSQVELNRMSKWVGIIKAISSAIAFFMTLYTLFLVGPSLETRYYPVLKPLEIVDIQPETPETSRLRVAFTKVRDCQYIGTVWFRGTRSGLFERVPLITRDAKDLAPPTRPVGYQRAGPWIVAMPASEIRDNSFVDVFHRCHPFWITKTHFYPGVEIEQEAE